MAYIFGDKHAIHLHIQEAVRQRDEESLEPEKNIPCGDEDCLLK